ncbi:MAG: hypothetical protein L0Z62_30975 [Gemmataceae bacterium]|nr:hypothetical protein [Gemmataceae bacterium]
MMPVRSDPLSLPLERLKEALASEVVGRERAWAENLRSALATMEVALRQHAAEADAQDGLFAQVDLTRPTLVRQVGGLRQEHTELLAQAEAMQRQVQRAADTFASQAVSAPLASPLPEPTPPQSVPDFGAIRQDGEQLVAALRQHSEWETDILLESVETDIGVCD